MTVDEVVAALLELGFQPAGETRAETVRVPTTRSLLLNHGRSGGELRTFGGRSRFALVGTNLRATVGPRTVNLYHFYEDSRLARFILNARTKTLTAEILREAIDGAMSVGESE